MSSTPPGWYPDPQDPRAVRWFDGQSWTEDRAAAAPPGTAAGQPWQPGQRPAAGAHSHTRLLAIVGVVVVVFILVSVLASSAIPAYLTQLKIAKPPAVATLTCQDVAEEIVALGAKNDYPRLVSMTDAVLIEDQRAGLKTPAPGSEALVMKCRGMAAWEDGVSKVTIVSLDLASDGKQRYVLGPG